MACEARIIRALRTIEYPGLDHVSGSAATGRSLVAQPHELAKIVGWIEDRKVCATGFGTEKEEGLEDLPVGGILQGLPDHPRVGSHSRSRAGNGWPEVIFVITQTPLPAHRSSSIAQRACTTAVQRLDSCFVVILLSNTVRMGLVYIEHDITCMAHSRTKREIVLTPTV